MLGKDYMLAIILVNCDGVHGGARWEDRELRGNEGVDGVCFTVRTRGQMNPGSLRCKGHFGSPA